MAGQIIQLQKTSALAAMHPSVLQTQLHSHCFLPRGMSQSICMSNRTKASCHFFMSCNMVMHAHITVAFLPDRARKCTLDGLVRPGKYERHTKIITALFTHTAEHAAPGLGLSPGLACQPPLPIPLSCIHSFVQSFIQSFNSFIHSLKHALASKLNESLPTRSGADST